MGKNNGPNNNVGLLKFRLGKTFRVLVVEISDRPNPL
jgi:hypothetical protein